LRPITAPTPGRDLNRPEGGSFLVWVRYVAMCAAAHRPGNYRCTLATIGREADTRGDTAMTKFFRSADAAEIYALEHRFPFATTLISLFLAGNVGSAVVMLIAQA
jgi:hypothetical protein